MSYSNPIDKSADLKPVRDSDTASSRLDKSKLQPAPETIASVQALTVPPIRLDWRGWLLVGLAFGLLVLLVAGWIITGNENYLWIGLAIGMGLGLAAGAAYVTRRTILEKLEEQRKVYLLDLSVYEQSQRTLSSGLEGMSEALLLAEIEGRLIYSNKNADNLLRWCRRYNPTALPVTIDDWLARIRPSVSNYDTFKIGLRVARQLSGQGQVPSFEFSVEKPLIADSDIETPLRTAPFLNGVGEVGRDPAGDLAHRPVRDLRMTLFPIDDASGRQIGTGYLIRDVTRDRELDRLKDQFMSMVSHELRTPISLILSITELMQFETEMAVPERVRWVGQINSEALRLRAMLNDMLDIARLEEGKLELMLAPLDLRAAAQQVVDAYVFQKQGNHTITVTSEVPNNRVMADSGKLNQILTNLIGNAIKYSPDGGNITITIRKAKPTDEDEVIEAAEMLEVAIKDEGMGIPTQEQAKIFTRFYRSSTSRKSSVSGTGLGLSITQRLVKIQGGNIGFESAEGQGSTFYFSLPAAPSTSPTPQN